MAGKIESIIYYEIGKGADDLPNVTGYFKQPVGIADAEALVAAQIERGELPGRQRRPLPPSGHVHDGQDHEHHDPHTALPEADLSIGIDQGKNLYAIMLSGLKHPDFDGRVKFHTDPITLLGLNGPQTNNLLKNVKIVSDKGGKEPGKWLLFECDRQELIKGVAKIFGNDNPPEDARFLVPFFLDLRDRKTGWPIGLMADHSVGEPAGLMCCDQDASKKRAERKHGGYHPPGLATYLLV